MYKNSHCFSLKPTLYAARFEESIIILDSLNNNYLSLINDSAKSLVYILENEFQQDITGYYQAINNMHYDSKELTGWINYFIEQNFIIQGSKIIHKFNVPLRSGGLVSYQWSFKSGWKSFLQTSWIDILQAFFILRKIHKIMDNHGIHGIIESIKNIAHKQNSDPNEQEITRLSTAIDVASILYSKKTFCLAWAATFVTIACKKGWKSNLIIGIQTNPFYAHAWAESSMVSVINDNPLVAEVLSIILKEPNTPI